MRKAGVVFLSKEWGSFMAKGKPGTGKPVKERTGIKMPDDFCINGWCRANNYLLKEEDFESKQLYNQERFRRSGVVMRAYQQTDVYKKSWSAVMADNWEERARAARQASDTTEVLLLEKLTAREDGVTTSELVANCINLIAKELAKRGASGVEQLELKDLVLISNTLIGLMKTASATKKEQGWKVPQVQVNNVTVNNSSKTGGVVGGLEDVIDIRNNK